MRLLLVGALAALAGALPTVYHRKPSDALEKRLEQQETTSIARSRRSTSLR